MAIFGALLDVLAPGTPQAVPDLACLNQDVAVKSPFIYKNDFALRVASVVSELTDRCWVSDEVGGLVVCFECVWGVGVREGVGVWL